jgi:hypothetical protein
MDDRGKTKWKSLTLLVLGIGFGYGTATFHSPRSVPLHAGDGSDRSTAHLIAVTQESPTGGQSIVLIDAKDKVFSVYEYDARKSKLKLSAVRQFHADHQLAEFNNDAPFVSDIEKLVKQR